MNVLGGPSHILWGAAWLSTVVFGMYYLAEYSATPGAVGSSVSRWPSGSTLSLNKDSPTLVMIAHPRCACTRASLEELAVIANRTGGRLRSMFCF